MDMKAQFILYLLIKQENSFVVRVDANLLIWRNNLDGKIIPNENKIKGGLAYRDSKKIPKSKSKKKYHLRSKSSKFSVKTRSTNNTDYPNSNIDAIINYNFNYNNKLKDNNINSQNINKNVEILSTNIDSKEINNNKLLKDNKNHNLFFSNGMPKNIENMNNKLYNATKIMQNMNQKKIF